MNNRKILIIFAFLCSISVIPDSFGEKKYDSLVYSPIRPDNSDIDVVPSNDEIKNDMQILEQFTDTIVLFDSKYAAEGVLEIAQELDMRVVLIVDLYKDEKINMDMIEVALVENRHYSSLDTVIIGSNEIADKTMDIPKLIEFIDYARFLTDGKDIKISSMNNAGIWIKDVDRKLSNSVDVIYFDSFQYHDKAVVEKAVSNTIDQIQTMQGFFSDKETISMVGWPTQGSNSATVPNQTKFTNALLEKSPSKLVFFEAFDESWKSKVTGTPEEAFWGFIDADRNIKEGILKIAQETDVKEPQDYIDSMIITGLSLAAIAIGTKVATMIMSPKIGGMTNS